MSLLNSLALKVELHNGNPIAKLNQFNTRAVMLHEERRQFCFPNAQCRGAHIPTMVLCHTLLFGKTSKNKEERNKMRKRCKKEDRLDDLVHKKKEKKENTQALPLSSEHSAFYSHCLEGANNELRAVQPTEMPRQFIN